MLITPEWLQAAEDVIVCFTPFILAYITYTTSKKEKKSNENKKLKEANDKLQKQINDELEKKRDDQLLNLQDNVKSLTDDIVKVNKNMDVITHEVSTSADKINDLLRLSNVNLQYSQSLSMLITTIGEGLRDKHMDGNFTEAIADHKKKEQDLFASIFKSSC